MPWLADCLFVRSTQVRLYKPGVRERAGVQIVQTECRCGLVVALERRRHREVHRHRLIRQHDKAIAPTQFTRTSLRFTTSRERTQTAQHGRRPDPHARTTEPARRMTARRAALGAGARLQRRDGRSAPRGGAWRRLRPSPPAPLLIGRPRTPPHAPPGA